MSHHLNWLTEAQQALRNPSTITAEQRRAFLRLCDSILQQNPASDVTKEVKRQLEGLFSAPEKKTVGRFDTTDMLTNKRVVNIAFDDDQDGTLFTFIGDGLKDAIALAQKTGEGQNIRELVEMCDKQGPFPGFAEVLPPEDLCRLENADEELLLKCWNQFMRLNCGDCVRKMMQDVGKTLNQCIPPIRGLIRSESRRRSVDEALKMWNDNANNVASNFFYASDRADTLRSTDKFEYALRIMENPSHFFVRIVDDPSAFAYYAPSERALALPLNSNYDFVDALLIIHELTHVQQHERYLCIRGRNTAEQLQESHEKYLESQSFISAVENECEAYANMIELMAARIQYDGGGAKLKNELVASCHNIQEQERKIEILRRLSAFSKEYVKPAAQGEIYARDYKKMIGGITRRD